MEAGIWRFQFPLSWKGVLDEIPFTGEPLYKEEVHRTSPLQAGGFQLPRLAGCES